METNFDRIKSVCNEYKNDIMLSHWIRCPGDCNICRYIFPEADPLCPCIYYRKKLGYYKQQKQDNFLLAMASRIVYLRAMLCLKRFEKGKK